MAEASPPPVSTEATNGEAAAQSGAALPEEPVIARVIIEDVQGHARTRIVIGSEGATSLSSVFTLCNSCIGAGVLSLPYAFKKAGALPTGKFLLWQLREGQRLSRTSPSADSGHACIGLVGCIIMCLILASAEAFTLYVLSKMAERYNSKTYGTLVRKALGRKLSSGELHSTYSFT